MITIRAIYYAATASVLLILSAAAPTNAQVILDMSVLKCKDYLGAPPEQQELIAAWMSGYFNAARDMPIVDLKRFATNKQSVEKYCKRRKNENDNLMNVIRKVAI